MQSTIKLPIVHPSLYSEYTIKQINKQTKNNGGAIFLKLHFCEMFQVCYVREFRVSNPVPNARDMDKHNQTKIPVEHCLSATRIPAFLII